MNGKTKLLAIFIAGGGALGFAGGVQASGWDDGPCNSDTAPTACIEYQRSSDGTWFHINGDHSGWHGPLPNHLTDSFVFSGETDLTCSGVVNIDATCNLTLTGQVRKDPNIGIMVTGGSVTRGVTNDPQCDTIVLSNTPWYVGPDSAHTFNNASGLPFVPGATSYTGAIGNIGFKVGSFPTISGHMHGITYKNEAPGVRSTFTFDSDVMTRVLVDISTGCHVKGVLDVQDPVADINIRSWE